jgi:cyanophycinase
MFTDNGRNFKYKSSCGEASPPNIAIKSGVLLIGGAEEGKSGEKEATRWLLDRAKGGNYLVIRFGELGGQADWICEQYRELINSAAELSIGSREAANNPDVINYLRHADILFFAGGDQNQYEDLWEGTEVEKTINQLINHKKIPIAGTSAGMAILGNFYYAPAHEGVLSSEILNDPFHHNTKDFYRCDFIKVPFLQRVITDTHLDRLNEDYREQRYGRIFGFLARNVYDNDNQLPSYAIGLEEGAFVAIDEQGVATVYGNGTKQGQDAYFLQTNGALPERIEQDKPLRWNNHGQAVKVYRIEGTRSGSGQFDLKDWSTVSGGQWEYWFTTGGISGFKRVSLS